jgi:hypothetical protein
MRAGDLSAHYTDAGVLPSDGLPSVEAYDTNSSLHLMSGLQIGLSGCVLAQGPSMDVMSCLCGDRAAGLFCCLT